MKTATQAKPLKDRSAAAPAPEPPEAPERAEPAPAEKPCLRRGAGGLLEVVRKDKRTPVKVCQSFPWTHPGRFLSLRDSEGKEKAFINNIEDLDAESQAALFEELTDARFVLEVTRILSIELEYEINNWTIETRQGARTFQTKKDAFPWEAPNGGYLLRDVAGDLYFIRDPEQMDDKSQRLLWAWVD